MPAFRNLEGTTMAGDNRSAEGWVIAAAIGLAGLAFAAYKWLDEQLQTATVQPKPPEPPPPPER